MTAVPIRRTERGFAVWAELACTYGTKVTVHDSSAATSPAFWLSLIEDRAVLRNSRPGEASAHLSLEQARQLRDALTAAIATAYDEWEVKP